jgi:HD-GYP domain-containing protein (c-di-GMP phosphodiesterase class II)
MTEGVSLVFTHSDGGTSKSESIVASGIRTALCAPLASAQGTFGIIQLDIRGNKRGNFSKKDVDRIAVFASHMGLILENYRLYLDQRRAFESTISALVHSLSLKDPATAEHSMRVRNVSVYLGLQQGLSDRELESLRVAALLHDMGKQGVSDDVLLKPGRLSDTEREEMSQHSEMTQNILDKIAYPPHLKDVPTLAAYHHEKMNGSGPFKLVGKDIPIQSRIIAIADVFDALVSARVYKKPMSPEQALAILDKGKNIEFDPLLVDTLRNCIAGIMEEIYSDSDTEADLAA